jgi:flagellar biosynthesis protein
MNREDPKKAVALVYDQSLDNAPKIVARGRGLLAEKIMAIARQHHIPLQQDTELAALLELLEPGTEIPPELYQAVAEILAFVYRLNQEYTPQ